MKFSVLMATSSREQPGYLSECLQSLADQTLRADQIVLVKDGELGSVLDAIVDQYAYLPINAVLYEGGKKLGGALSFGLKYCDHLVVARMDSDDIAVPTRFEHQLNFLLRSGADIAGGSIAEFGASSRQVNSIRRCPGHIRKRHISRRNPFNHMTVMFHKQAVIDAGGYQPLEFFEDWYLWLRMFSNNAVMRNTREILVRARTDSGFFSRRSGIHYALREAHALSRFRREKLISNRAFILNFFTRIPARFLPEKLLQIVYIWFLRKRRT